MANGRRNSRQAAFNMKTSISDHAKNKKQLRQRHRRSKENNASPVQHLLSPVEVPNSRSGTYELLNCARTLVGQPAGRITTLQVVDPLGCVVDFGNGPVVRHSPNNSLIAKAHRRLKSIQKRLAARPARRLHCCFRHSGRANSYCRQDS